MEDIAKIGFQAETAPLVKAKSDLENLGPAAEKAENAADKLGRKFGWVKDQQGKWRDEFGKLVPKIKLAENGLNNFESKIGVFGGSLNKVKGFLTEFGTGMLAAFGVGAAAIGIQQFTSILSDFEYEMSTVAAVSGATGKELQALRDTAKDMGATTEFSATQAATGLKLLVQAGYDTKTAIGTLPSVLNLATTEAMDLGVATEYVVSIMQGFGLGSNEAARAADVLVYASNAASTGVAELGEGMKYVAPISASLGISIEDTAAAMGILSNAGIKGSMAGTALNGVLASLASPTKQAADELNRLGLNIAQVNPATNDIVDIVDRLAGAGLDAAAAFKIFGREAAPGILALTKNKDALRQMTGEMGNVAGEAKRIADYMRDNFKGSLQNLSSSLEAVIIALGDAGLTAVLRGVVDALTFVISTVASAITSFSNWISSIGPLNAALSSIASNSNLVIGAISGIAVAWAATYVPAVAAATLAGANWIAGAYIMNGGLMGLAAGAVRAAAGFVTLRGAIAATGFGAIAIAAGLLIAKVLELKDELGSIGAVWELAKRLGLDFFNRIVAGASWAGAQVSIIWQKIQISFTQAVNNMRRQWAALLSEISQSMSESWLPGGDAIGSALGGAAIDAMGAADGVEHELGRMKKALDETSSKAANLKNQMIKPLNFDQMKVDAKLASLGLKDLNAEIPKTGEAVKPVAEIVPPAGAAIEDMGKKAGGAAEKSKELKTALQLLTEEFQKLTEPFDQASSAFDALEKAKELGIISNDAYVASLERIHQAFLKTGGTADQWGKIVNKNTDTVAKQMDELAKKSVTDLGNSFAELATGGSANFADLAKNIIKQLIMIAWQAMVVKPLLSWMGFADGGTFGGGDPLTGALQGAGAPAVQPAAFAKGSAFTNSVVRSPTPFKFAQGGGFGLGVMGEAGPEAVMPLTRGPDGALGVQMYGATGTQQAAQAQRMALDVRFTAEEGEMFRPVVKGIARDESVEVTQNAMAQMNEQLPDRVEQIVSDPRLKGA